MRSILLFTVMMLSLIMFTGCEKKCPEPVYPKLEAIDRIPRISITVENGILDQNNTKKAFKTIKALRVSEHYYYRLISDYRAEFIK